MYAYAVEHEWVTVEEYTRTPCGCSPVRDRLVPLRETNRKLAAGLKAKPADPQNS